MKRTFKKAISVFLVVPMLLCAAPLNGFVGLELPDFFSFDSKAAEIGDNVPTETTTNTVLETITVAPTPDVSTTKVSTQENTTVMEGTTVYDYSGVCGPNLTWTLDDNGVLTIEGTGAMYDFNSGEYITVYIGEEPNTEYETTEKPYETTESPYYDYTTMGPDRPTSVVTTKSPATTKPATYPTTTNPDDYYYNSVNGITPVEEEVCSVIHEESTTAPNIVLQAEIGDNVPTTRNETTAKYNETTTAPYNDYIKIYRWNKHIDKIKKVVISEGITSIGKYAFYNCINLEEVEISGSINSIKYYAFYNCDSLTDVYYGSTEGDWNQISIGYNNEPLRYATKHYATTGTCGNNLTWSFDVKSGKLEISGIGEMYDFDYESKKAPWRGYNIKEVKIDNGVSSIGDKAFAYCGNLIDITIPSSVKNIGDYAFYDCDSLEDLVIPNAVQSIGSNAFASSGLVKIIIPDSVTTIEEWAFGDCYSLEFLKIGNGITKIEPYTFVQCYSLRYVILGENITTIGKYSFHGCDINFLTLHKKISTIEEGAFRYCDFLSEVFYKGKSSEWNNIVISKDNDVLTSANIYFEDDATSELNKGLSWSFDDETGTLYINGEGEIGWNGGELPPWNNHRPDVMKVVVGNGITSLGSAMFSDFMYLEEVVLPEGITAIGDWTFDSCIFLYKIELPDTIKSIGDFAFWGCTSLEKVCVSRNVETIGMFAFAGCNSLKTVTLENGIVKIGNSAFEGCDFLESITIPESVTEIGYDAFYYCTNLREVGFNAINCVYAGASDDVYSAFYGCENLTDVIIGEKVESIPACFLSGCRNVERIIIPDSVKTIGHHAFWRCYSLSNISIGNNIEEIGGWAFDYTGYFNNKDNCVNNLICLDYCLIGVSGYDIVVDDSITVIQDHVFRSHWAIETVTLPSWLTEIDDYMFDGCYSLYSVEIPAGVKKIGAYAFYNCSNLSGLDLPETVETIGDYAFGYCTSITHMRIPNSIKRISDTAFWGCNTIDLHCEEGSYGCYYAEANRMNMSIFMKEVGGYCIIKNGVLTNFYGEGFDDYEYHCNLVIPSNVKSIGYYAFENNNRIVNIELPYSVTTIYSRAFANCPNLEGVIIPFTVTDIADSAFEDTDAIIYCYYNSYAYNYAIENGLKYELITVTLSTNSVNMNSGGSVTVNAVPSVTVASGIPMVWKSSNTDVVSVDSAGNIVANAVGSATIGIYSFDGTLFDECSVTVSKPVDEFENVELKFEDVSTDTLKYGEKILLHINVADLPEGTSVKWTTSNGAVLRISNENAACTTHESCVTCTVESVGSGSAEITGIVVDENGEPVLRDGEEIKVSYTMNSKAGFFQKLIAFFKKLFGLSKVILQST